ncbi:MAG: tRNA 2-selenouridine(34) synthase MnmH [Ginsengibacter sp.]
MAIEQLDIENFLKHAEEVPVLDVRSPTEFSHAHIPGALTLPLFTDEQRKIIGTAYKKQSRQVAVKKGLEYFSERMKNIIVEAEDIIKEVNRNDSTNNRVLIHCWRGGMRSRAVAWLLDLYGFKVFTLKGGYKAFRNWALKQFEKNYNFKILGGYTGSGKTDLLNALQTKGKKVINLEQLANHKGSAFGSIGEKPQPGQEMFENLLALDLFKKSGVAEDRNKGNNNGALSDLNEIWLEDESRHIGTVGIPKTLWSEIRKSKLYFLDIPFDERLDQIISTYGAFDKSALVNSIMKIQKRLGGLETKNAINYLHENKMRESFSILLLYYDKLYTNALFKRDNIELVLNKIPCKTVDIRNVASLD